MRTNNADTSPPPIAVWWLIMAVGGAGEFIAIATETFTLVPFAAVVGLAGAVGVSVTTRKRRARR